MTIITRPMVIFEVNDSGGKPTAEIDESTILQAEAEDIYRYLKEIAISIFEYQWPY
jgi:hypothetical protein